MIPGALVVVAGAVVGAIRPFLAGVERVDVFKEVEEVERAAFVTVRGILRFQEYRMTADAPPEPGVQLTTIRCWAAGLDALHARIAPRFRRAEVRPERGAGLDSETMESVVASARRG